MADNPIGGLAARLPASLTSRYRPERLLATGGYGDVWLAQQIALSRQVALKVLQADAVTDPDERKRFLAEAKITASLSHPNIVIVLDHGVDDGVPWIAYEFVSGRSLREVLDNEALTWPLALDAARQIARALEEAHAAGILHRDIKPENVLEAGRGRYKVTDFGIAKWAGKDRARTHTGALMGSPSYISPEQIAGRELTPACDIYGLGCMLFEMLVGRVPFGNAQMTNVLNDHLNKPPPRVTDLKPELPPPLGGLVERALRKEPKDRFESASAMREAIDLFIGSSDALQLPEVPPDPNGHRAAGEFKVPSAARQAFPDQPRPSRPSAPQRIVGAPGSRGTTAPVSAIAASRTVRLAGTVFCAALLAGALWMLRSRPPPPPPPEPSIESVRFEAGEVEVSIAAGAQRMKQRFPAAGAYPRQLSFQVPDASGVVQVASIELTADRAATALIDSLSGLPDELARLPADAKLREIARDRKKVDEAALRTRVAGALTPRLVELWGIAAAHAGPLLATDLPLPSAARLLERISSLEDLTLRLRGFRLPAPVSLASAYADRWRPFYDAPAGKPTGCDVDPGPPVSAEARALLHELHTAPAAGGMALPIHLVCASYDFAGRAIPRDAAQKQMVRLLQDWVTMGLLNAPPFPVEQARIEEVLPFRHRATFSLASVGARPYVGAAMRPRLLASLRVTVNGQVTVRLAQREAVDPSQGGGITCFHALDPRCLRQGPNELIVEGVAVINSPDEPPWTGFDTLFVGMNETR